MASLAICHAHTCTASEFFTARIARAGLIDPDLSSGAFHERLARVAAAVARDEGARMPGQGRVPADPAEIDDTAWMRARALAGG